MVAVGVDARKAGWVAIILREGSVPEAAQRDPVEQRAIEGVQAPVVGLTRHLAMNGGRPEHHTRYYLGGMTLKAAMSAVEDHSPHWHVVCIR